MKVAIVGPGVIHLPWTSQGNAMEILTYELARKLAIEHSVIVYSKREKGQTIIEQDQGVTYKRIGSTRDRGYIWFSTLINSTFPNYSRSRAKKPFFALKGYYHNWALKVVEDVCSENCDIIHIHNLSQFVPLFRKALPSVKIVLHMHVEWLTQLDRELIENRLNEADLILSCSEFITEKTRTIFPKHSENCKTLHNGVDVHKFTIQENKNGRSEEKKVLFVGRNSPEKGVHLLIKAFENAVSQYPQLNLQIIGPQGPAPIMQGRELVLYLSDDPKVKRLGPLYNKNYLVNIRKSLTPDLISKIKFTGYLPRKELITCYQDSDVFIFPPVWEEPFGMPVIEAMSTATPVIGTNVGGLKETIEHEVTGVLVEPNDDLTLANSLVKLLTDDKKRERMGHEARKQMITKYSWECISNTLIDYYDELF